MSRSPSATLPLRTAVLTAPPPPAQPTAPSGVRPAPSVRVLSFADPLPGFPGRHEYALVPADTSGRVFWLQSVSPEGPRFLAVPAAPYFPEYAPAVPPAVCAELGLADSRDAEVYCLVTVPDGDITAATANLRAPVVVDPVTSRARQVVLADGRHPIRRPLRR